jgi:hypothetical protein
VKGEMSLTQDYLLIGKSNFVARRNFIVPERSLSKVLFSFVLFSFYFLTEKALGKRCLK